ncbi:MAG: hypothetical protein NTZ69_15810 [Bacteroidia bacterium]|nr:hypothetical protein [Bacteroidia bacterium]
MRTINRIFIAAFAIIGLTAEIAAMTKAPHQWVVALLCLLMVFALSADEKKERSKAKARLQRMNQRRQANV